MSQLKRRKRIHPDLQVLHSIPGRIRLRARKIYRQSQDADEIMRKLSGIQGLHHVEASPTTGSITMQYQRAALDSVTFFAEIAAVLGLIAEGIDPSSVEALFDFVSPADVAKPLDRQHLVLPIATFALGLFIGQK